MTVLYITSDRPGAGKTALAGALAAQLSSSGTKVGYLKPVSPTPQNDADVTLIWEGLLAAHHDEGTPVPMPSGEGPLPGAEARGLEEAIKALSAANQVVIVEGPSLANSAGVASSSASDLAELLDGSVLLMVQYRQDLTPEAVLEACEPFRQRLLGVLINSVTRYKELEVRQRVGPALESQGVRFLGAIPEDRVMLSVTVGQIAQHLDGRWVIGEEKAQDLVEEFLIGGNIMDQGITYFGRTENKAVIVRGDRPDIQLAALSTPTICLVLTGGHEPIQYVYHQAEEQEVPMLVVQADTMTTADALDAMIEKSTVHHPRKLHRYQELVQQHADMSVITTDGQAG